MQQRNFPQEYFGRYAFRRQNSSCGRPLRHPRYAGGCSQWRRLEPRHRGKPLPNQSSRPWYALNTAWLIMHLPVSPPEYRDPILFPTSLFFTQPGIAHMFHAPLHSTARKISMHTVIIIDASVPDQHALITGLPDDAEILLLNAVDCGQTTDC